MKAKQLIEILQNIDPETLIVVDGYETGIDTPVKAVPIKIQKNSRDKWWDGEYDFILEKNEGINALYLPRKS